MFDTRKIKVYIYLVWVSSALAAPQGPELTLDIIDLAAISRMTPQQLEQLAEGLAMQEIMRTKRSSAQSAISAVVSKASSGLQGKIGLLGQASAGIAASASSKTSFGDDHHHGYSYEPHDDNKVDYWGLKKSILYTLFQAVKAITGGVTILKGQLIKGGGALASSLGKVIKVKGDAVSNLGKKIVSSAALSPKKQHSSSHVPVVYGPPPSHHDFPPTAYGPPTAPGHYAHSAPTAHAAIAPSGYASHKYPQHLDGRGKLGGLHAGLILLTPLGHGPHVAEETAEAPVVVPPAHTPLEPPHSFLSTAFSAIKEVFSPAPPDTRSPAPVVAPPENDIENHPPPPPPSFPHFKPMSWGAAVNSYGEPAAPEIYQDYSPHQSHPPYDIYAHSKSSIPKQHGHKLSPEKIQKIQKNLQKVLEMHNNQHHQRSFDDLPRFDGIDVYRNMLEKGGKIPFLPTPVVTDAEIGVLSADLQPAEPTSTTTTTTTTTTEKMKVQTTATENTRRRKDIKYILRGNRIVEVSKQT